MRSEVFLYQTGAFSTEAFSEFLSGSATLARERIKYFVRSGRLKRIAKSLYAVVPPGKSAKKFIPNTYVVAGASRPDSILSHHTSLELLGAAHSVFFVHTVLCGERRQSFKVANINVKFLLHPLSLRKKNDLFLGTNTLEMREGTVRFTGKERTLLDGFKSPGLVGGLLEHAESILGLEAFDFDLMERLLKTYDEHVLYSLTGYFLEQQAVRLQVPQKLILRCEKNASKSPYYAAGRLRGGGTFKKRWNLIVPRELEKLLEA